jgi:hypothetical protein
MANTFYNAPQVAKTAVAMAVEDSYLGALVSRNFQNDLLGGGGKNLTVNVRVPSALIARERGIDDISTAIVLDSLTESTISVTLGTHAYSAVALSEGDMSLHLESFAAQVLAPQVDAVVDDVEHTVATALLAADGFQTGEDPASGDPGHIVYDETDPVKLFIALRRILRNRGVPTAGLNVVVGTQIYADLLSSQKLQDASASGSTAALREGQVGRVQGLTVVESTRVPENDLIAFHSDAFTLAVRAPIVPAGVSFGAFEASDGYSLRYIRDYDASVLKDRSIVSTFAGVQPMPLYKVTRDYSAETATVAEVPGGAAIHLDVTTLV